MLVSCAVTDFIRIPPHSSDEPREKGHRWIPYTVAASLKCHCLFFATFEVAIKRMLSSREWSGGPGNFTMDQAFFNLADETSQCGLLMRSQSFLSKIIE